VGWRDIFIRLVAVYHGPKRLRPGGSDGRNLFRISDYSPEKLNARLKGNRIKCPVRGVWGDTDRALSKELAHAVKDRIDGPFDLHFIKNCGHWVQQEAPEEYNEQLADFLEIRSS
jgi:pimeloyl-ACP methyl ester carboxylesterase